ncbi:MAG: cysteine--tRNA ligase, partial [Thermoplasmatota archaeon]
MAVVLYNVRTRSKTPFTPRGREVGLYVCGLTVYDHAHIGHARTYAAFDVLRIWLEYRFGAVRHVQNTTDIDDKIIRRAKEGGVSPRLHAKLWDDRCRIALERLGIRVPAGPDNPHVTECVPEIVAFTRALVERGLAYVTPEGNVYFDVPTYAKQGLKDPEGHDASYGSLSGRDYRDLAAGTRKEVEADKRNPADFALWKAAQEGDDPDAVWPSHWPGVRPGRPGWHIECTVMATGTLGHPIDIHGGGEDLIYP